MFARMRASQTTILCTLLFIALLVIYTLFPLQHLNNQVEETYSKINSNKDNMVTVNFFNLNENKSLDLIGTDRNVNKNEPKLNTVINLNENKSIDLLETAKNINAILSNDKITTQITTEDIMMSDYMKIPKIPFLTKFKNPCFKVQDGAHVDLQVKCLPYFMIGGFPKTGTTDLYKRMNRHPLVMGPAKGKEPLWWSICRYAINRKSFSHYLGNIGNTGHITSYAVNINGTEYHPKIVGDYSTREMLMERTPWVDGATTPHMMHHLIPDVKFIVLMREPIARLYSDYIYFSRNYINQVSPENFHIAVTRAVNWWRQCTSNYTIRDCLYGPGPSALKPIFSGAPFSDCWKPFLPNNICGYFRVGFYYYYLKDWLEVFPRQQFLFLRSEDFVNNPAGIIHNRVLPFLNIDKNSMNKSKLSGTITTINRVKTSLKKNGKYRPMLNSTRVLLFELYKEPNRQLAHLLNNEAYVWNDFA